MGVRLRLYGCERMRRERMIGECIVSFSSLPAALDYPLEQWLTLEPRSNISVRHQLSLSLSSLLSLHAAYSMVITFSSLYTSK